MGFFKRRRKKKEKEIEGLFDKYSENGTVIEQKHQVEHEALGFCEQLIEASRELTEVRKEYRLVTDYLNDVQTLEDLPGEEMRKLQDTAGNIASLSQNKEAYSNKKKRLSDVQFLQLEQLEAEMPDDIRRLQANESYQSMVKRDMDYLEGEKSEWGYYTESLLREQKFLKAAQWVLLVVVAVGVSVIEYIRLAHYKDVTLLLMAFLLAAATAGGGCILRSQNNRREQKRAHASIDRAITLSNQMKARYVNVTNAVDYACEKFHVRNSMELNYLWEQYLEAVREREAMVKNNEDLEYFSRKLVRELKSYQMYDAAIWVHQVHAILDKKEMVEVKHYLIVRRQKLRSRMEQQVAEIQKYKNHMQKLLKERPEYQREIMDVLDSVDRMCGL